jgi:hypothetical protein
MPVKKTEPVRANAAAMKLKKQSKYGTTREEGDAALHMQSLMGCAWLKPRLHQLAKGPTPGRPCTARPIILELEDEPDGRESGQRRNQLHKKTNRCGTPRVPYRWDWFGGICLL